MKLYTKINKDKVFVIAILYLLFFSINSSANSGGSLEYFKQGNVFFFSQDYVEAIKNYDKALKLNDQWIKDNRSAVYRHLGLSYQGSQNYVEAIKNYDEAIRTNSYGRRQIVPRQLSFPVGDNYGCRLVSTVASSKIELPTAHS